LGKLGRGKLKRGIYDAYPVIEDILLQIISLALLKLMPMSPVFPMNGISLVTFGWILSTVETNQKTKERTGIKLKEIKDKLVLDVGCGLGALPKLLANMEVM